MRDEVTYGKAGPLIVLQFASEAACALHIGKSEELWYSLSVHLITR
jgi:hypothetical protein